MPKPKKKLRRSKSNGKDEEVEKRDLSLLHGNMPVERDRMYHFDNVLGHMAKVKSAQGRLSDAKKKAKEAGVDVGAMMTVMKLERMDPLDLATTLRQQVEMMRDRGLPVQAQLFEPSYGSIEEQAEFEGRKAGEAGRSPDTGRWPEGSPGYDAYQKAWLAAQAEMVPGA